MSRRAATIALGLVFVAGAAGAASLEDAIPSGESDFLELSAFEVLDRALTNMYGCDLQQEVEFVTRTTSGIARRQRVNLLRKEIDGRAHFLMRYLTQNEFYDMRVLKIENHHRHDDHFIWVPEFRRVRRFSSAQRADAFQGTDLTLEDVEFRRARTFEILGRSADVRDGERVHVLTIRPFFESGYERAILYIALNDYAIREVRYFRKGKNRPYKVARAPREELNHIRGFILPGRWEFTDYEKGTRTDAIFNIIGVNPELDDGLFSERTLETGRPLPGVDYKVDGAN